MNKDKKLNILYNTRTCLTWLKVVENKHKCLINKVIKDLEKLIEETRKEL